MEALSQEYSDKAYRLDLVPSTAKNANGMNFALKLDTSAKRFDKMVSVDLRGPVKVSSFGTLWFQLNVRMPLLNCERYLRMRH